MAKMIIVSVMALLFSPTVTTAATLRWEPPGPYPTKAECQPISFDQPDAIAVDKSDNIYIANETGQNAVQEVNVANGTVRTILDRSVEPTKSGNYSGISLALGPKGDLFLAVKQRGTVERLNADGTLRVIAGKPSDRRLVDGPVSKARLEAPNAIAIGEHGVIYVADTRTVRKIGMDGSIVTLAGNPRVKSPQYPTPGEEPSDFDGRGANATFLSADALAVDSHGNIYVADSFDGILDEQWVDIGLVREVTASGVVRTVAGRFDDVGDDHDDVGANASFSHLAAIAIASSGDMYVTEPYSASVRQIDHHWHVTSLIPESDPSDLSTALDTPSGIAIGSNHSLIVEDDVALHGRRFIKGRSAYWLHRIIAGKLETLCSEQKAGK